MKKLVAVFCLLLAGAYGIWGIGHREIRVIPAGEITENTFIDFSSDRSTWFFSTTGKGGNQVAFCDFYYPFDPTVKTDAYDPLAMYTLDEPYHFSDNHLMIAMADLKKLYDPYFSYEVKPDSLEVRHTYYERIVTANAGTRAPTISYTKKVWDVSMPLSTGNSGQVKYTEYASFASTGTPGQVDAQPVNEANSIQAAAFTFPPGAALEIRHGKIYVPLAAFMELLGKKAINEAGYLAIQTIGMPDVTINGYAALPLVPGAGNPWRYGGYGANPNLTWAGYMDAVAEGTRITGWQWRAFHIPSGNIFFSVDGNAVSLDANRIVPTNIYVPTTYNTDTTRLTFMLHGGTGNENAPSDRVISRNMHLDVVAEEYNYIIVSPNGYTRSPAWRQNWALYSFLTTYDMALREYNIPANRVFITGNSAGGAGTFDLAMRYPTRFRAMAATSPSIPNEAGNFSLAGIRNMPTMVTQATRDVTIAFRGQAGNPENPGMFGTRLVPHLDNITFLAQEEGHHSFAFGSVLRPIFDFFESRLTPYTVSNVFDDLVVNFDGTTVTSVTLDARPYNNHRMIVTGDQVMAPLGILADIYGQEFLYYHITDCYNTDPNAKADFYTLIHNNNSINLSVDQTMYRVSNGGAMGTSRHKEDALALNDAPDLDLLNSAPHFAVAPFVNGADVMVPLKEVMEALGRTVIINGNP